MCLLIQLQEATNKTTLTDTESKVEVLSTPIYTPSFFVENFSNGHIFSLDGTMTYRDVKGEFGITINTETLFKILRKYAEESISGSGTSLKYSLQR